MDIQHEGDNSRQAPDRPIFTEVGGVAVNLSQLAGGVELSPEAREALALMTAAERLAAREVAPYSPEELAAIWDKAKSALVALPNDQFLRATLELERTRNKGGI